MATRTPAPDTRSVGVARDFCLATLHRWGIVERADDIAVVVSELLTNALRHGLPPTRGTRPGWPVRLGLAWPARFVLCAVADPGTAVPSPKEPDYFAESGRGLHVISALSDAWGCTAPTDAGKTVWAAFAVGSAPPPPASGQQPPAASIRPAASLGPAADERPAAARRPVSGVNALTRGGARPSPRLGPPAQDPGRIRRGPGGPPRRRHSRG